MRGLIVVVTACLTVCATPSTGSSEPGHHLFNPAARIDSSQVVNR